jgi:hypothetical protein
VAERLHLGRLAFGLAFIGIGSAWLVGGDDLGPGWLGVVSLLALGAAAIVAAVVPRK